MAAYEDAYPPYPQMAAQWHGHSAQLPDKLYPSLPASPPPVDHLQSPNAAPDQQDLNTLPRFSVHDTREAWRPVDSHTSRRQTNLLGHQVPRAQAERYAPTPVPDTSMWSPYKPLNRKSDEVHQIINQRSRSTKGQNVPGQDQEQIGYLGSCTLSAQIEINPPAVPHMPGATRYLQERESRVGRVGSAENNLTAHMPGLQDTQLEHQNLGTGRTATVQPPRRIGATSGAILNNVNKSPSENCQDHLKRSMPASSPTHGTRFAPLEISSSPERELKRRKTAKVPQTTRSKPHEDHGPTGLMRNDGFSRQELTKMLAEAESTNVKPSKVRYYAVAIGRKTGVYLDWPSAQKQVHGFHGAKHKKFKTEEAALDYVEKYRNYIHDGPAATIERLLAQKTYESIYNPNSGYYEPYQPSLEQNKLINPSPLDLREDYVPLHDGPAPVIDDGPKLVPEQQHVVDLILQGHNVFYTGSAGCGKSTILKSFVRQLKNRGRRVKIVAPTNLAALNVGGQTTWNFAGWTPDSMKIHIEKLKKNSLGKESWKKFDETDVLVIDEISMIENLQFQRLNEILKYSRGDKHGRGAFGGIQMIVTGDFYQLAPVKPFSHCMCGWELERDNQHNPKEYTCTNKGCREHTFHDIDKWAFRSHAWEECDFKHVNLTQIHRQSDMMFKSILNRIRTDGTILRPHARVLLNHTSETEGAIEIYARRVDVDRVNNDNINKLPSSALAYKCVDCFDWPDFHRNDRTLERNTYRMPDGSLSALKEHRFETRVQLKLNQRVVLQANLEPSAGLVNGAQGTVIEFKEFDEKDLPKAPKKKGEDGELRGDHAAYREEQIKQFASVNGCQSWPVVRFTNGVVRTIFADCTVNVFGNEEPWCKLSRTQIPLAAGYAITVHKSQGMTLDRVTVDLARAFEPSQIYVALSRARSLKGLTVSALPRYDLGGANAQVKEFMENIVIKKKSALPAVT